MLTSHAALCLGHFYCGLGKKTELPPQITRTLHQVPEPFHEMYLAISVDLENKKKSDHDLENSISFRFKQMPTSTLKNVALLLQMSTSCIGKRQNKRGWGGGVCACVYYRLHNGNSVFVSCSSQFIQSIKLQKPISLMILIKRNVNSFLLIANCPLP